MYPILFRIGPITIYTYGFALALAFLLSGLIIIREAKKAGIDHGKVMDVFFYSLLAGLIGSRILYVLFNMGDYWPHIWKIFLLWEGGLVFYGGLLGGAPVCLWLIHHYNLPVWPVIDIIILPGPLAHAIGRIGCFMAGCCYGKSCAWPWAVIFTNKASLAPLNRAIHPTQLYSSSTNLLIFIILALVNRKKRFHGQILSVYLCLYPIGRIINEYFRADKRTVALYGPFTVTHLISMTMILSGLFLYYYLSKSCEQN
ncbi:MAG: prolipoprotein diacylglyceryl transferase [bacterium]